jgi:hypothetical protein
MKIVVSVETAAETLFIPLAPSTCWLSVFGWNCDANWEWTVAILTADTGAGRDITHSLDDKSFHILLPFANTA